MLDETLVNLLLQGSLETLYIVCVSTLLSYIIGLPLGVLLVVTDKDGIKPIPILNNILGFIVNIVRSVPFIILLVFVIPFTRAIVGTSLGSTATIVPLIIASAPYIARVVESSIKEVDKGVIEAAQSMGATVMQIVMRVMLREALPSLIVGAAITTTAILGYSAMAGFVGGGGLGTIAVNYGYYRYQDNIMLITVVLLVIIVQVFQEFGMRLSRAIDKRRR